MPWIKTPLIPNGAERIEEQYVAHHDEVRLPGAIGFVTPKDKPDGRRYPG